MMKKSLSLIVLIIIFLSASCYFGLTPCSVYANTPLVSTQILQGLKVVTAGDPNCVFDANSVVNTQKTITVTKPLQGVGKYGLVVYNPSTVTDLSVKVFDVDQALGGATRYTWVHTFTIPKSAATTGTTIDCHKNIIEDYIFNGTNARFVISNDTALGTGEGFTAFMRLWVVK